MAKDEGVDEATEKTHSFTEVEAFYCGFRPGVRLLIGDGVPLTKNHITHSGGINPAAETFI